MTAERWRQVKTIFHGAVETDPAVRADFLREHCGGDEELRREVESLLDSEKDPRSLLGTAVMGAAVMAAAPERQVPAPPAIMGDRYEVERELGRGGMSVVYLARDRQLLGKRVVIKVLLETTSIDPWMRQKFLQEMEALSRIDHPGVVGVLDTGLTAEGKQFLVMQYIEGVTLRSVIEPGGVNFVPAAGIIRQIGHALAAAHEKGVWHRDLKPENIMLQCLGGEDHVKLIDFGIAGIQNSQFSGEKTKVAGSLSYMAPEQFSGHPCEASDIYAFGVVAYEILTGTLPGETGESRPKLPERAERSIRKAMSLRPEDRQSSVRAFSEELCHALSGGETARKSAKSAVPGTVEMAHVLFTDLVGYSLLPMDRQKEYLGELQQIVRESPQCRAAEAAGDIISLPTGDGMALAFFGDPTAPAQCALEVAAGLQSKPHLKLRMGIHSGPVYRVADVNANANVAGGGINIAQRVMDCGDAGHILVSKTVADVLLQLSQWSPYLTNLGECTVKHGVKVHLYSLAKAELGNPERPRKLAGVPAPKARSKTRLAVGLALVLLAAAGAFWLGRGGKGSQPVQELPSIAVLPFVDMSPDKSVEYLADGLAEELRTGLARIEGLRVTGRTSSIQFKGKVEDSRVIGKQLNVATILNFALKLNGRRSRIGVDLVRAGDGFNLWSETFEREMNDIFAIEQEIARAVTGELKPKILGKNVAASSSKSTNTEAYNAYLQGQYFYGQRNKENLGKSADYFQQAIKLDPSYARAWAGLAKSRYAQADAQYVPSETGYQAAREAAEHTLQLDPNMGEAHAILGGIKLHYDWNWTDADSSFQRALVLEPWNVTVIGNAGVMAAVMGRLDEAIALHRRAIEIDPLNSVAYRNVGLYLYYAGRQQEATVALKKALELAPEGAVTHNILSHVYMAQAQPQEALSEANKEKDPELRLQALTLAYHALGRKKESDANLIELIGKFQEDDPYYIAEVYAFRRETDQAFEWLERAYTKRDSGLTEIKGDPLLKSLERDPRYTALLKKMRLPL